MGPFLNLNVAIVGTTLDNCLLRLMRTFSALKFHLALFWIPRHLIKKFESILVHLAEPCVTKVLVKSVLSLLFDVGEGRLLLVATLLNIPLRLFQEVLHPALLLEFGGHSQPQIILKHIKYRLGLLSC